jgi:hypothetical protein
MSPLTQRNLPDAGPDIAAAHLAPGTAHRTLPGIKAGAAIGLADGTRQEHEWYKATTIAEVRNALKDFEKLYGFEADEIQVPFEAVGDLPGRDNVNGIRVTPSAEVRKGNIKVIGTPVSIPSTEIPAVPPSVDPREIMRNLASQKAKPEALKTPAVLDTAKCVSHRCNERRVSNAVFYCKACLEQREAAIHCIREFNAWFDVWAIKHMYLASPLKLGGALEQMTDAILAKPFQSPQGITVAPPKPAVKYTDDTASARAIHQLMDETGKETPYRAGLERYKDYLAVKPAVEPAPEPEAAHELTAPVIAAATVAAESASAEVVVPLAAEAAEQPARKHDIPQKKWEKNRTDRKRKAKDRKRNRGKR